MAGGRRGRSRRRLADRSNSVGASGCHACPGASSTRHQEHEHVRDREGRYRSPRGRAATQRCRGHGHVRGCRDLGRRSRPDPAGTDQAAIRSGAAGSRGTRLEGTSLVPHGLGRYRPSAGHRGRVPSGRDLVSGVSPADGPGNRRRGNLPGSCCGAARSARRVRENRLERRQHHRAGVAAGTRGPLGAADARGRCPRHPRAARTVERGRLHDRRGGSDSCRHRSAASLECRSARSVRRGPQGPAKSARHAPHMGERRVGATPVR